MQLEMSIIIKSNCGFENVTVVRYSHHMNSKLGKKNLIEIILTNMIDVSVQKGISYHLMSYLKIIPFWP